VTRRKLNSLDDHFHNYWEKKMSGVCEIFPLFFFPLWFRACCIPPLLFAPPIFFPSHVDDEIDSKDRLSIVQQ
jgi:hypothetical protein